MTREQAQLEKAYELGKAEMQSSEDCISRTETMDMILCYGNEIKTEVMDDIKASMIKLSSVTPQQKTGHWIFKNDNIAIPTGYYQCSECEKGKLLVKDNYCPNCGAKMEVEE